MVGRAFCGVGIVGEVLCCRALSGKKFCFGINRYDSEMHARVIGVTAPIDVPHIVCV